MFYGCSRDPTRIPIMDDTINGVLSRTYSRQRQIDLRLRTLHLMSRKQTKQDETKREKGNLSIVQRYR